MESATGALAAGTGFALLLVILVFLVVGVVIGALARLVLPGRDDISIGKTILYGIAGSFLGGIVGRLIGVEGRLIGLAISVAVAALLIWFFTRRKTTTTG